MNGKRGWGEPSEKSASFTEWVMLLSMVVMIAALLLLVGLS